MKVGRPYSGDEVILPPEIINVIIRHIESRRPRPERQNDLWACCLLSKSWYSATVKYLYESPILTNRNFDLFSRTLCPPVNSHVRSIGLEVFVVNLDMNQLAYESTKSLTARLLRRIRLSLETFIAPSISFSLAGLAPLSKSEHLRHLDLSNDFYDIGLSQLLRAVCDLPRLHFLSLPKGALKGSYPRIQGPSLHRWPKALRHLQLNGIVPGSPDWWNCLMAELPSNLHTLTLSLQNALGRPYRLDFLGIADIQAPQITSLYIKHGTWGMSEIVVFSKLFPNLKNMILRYSYFALTELYHGVGPTVFSYSLESLTLLEDCKVHIDDQPANHPGISTDGVHLVISRFPALRRIEFPERVKLQCWQQSSIVKLSGLQDTFRQRWPSVPEQDVGVFVGQILNDVEPSWLKDTWGDVSTKKITG